MALPKNQNKQGVCHNVHLPFTFKKYLKSKRRIMKTQIFHHAKIKSLKKSSKRNQNPSRFYYNSITNLKFQHKPKYHLFKNPHIKIDLLLLLLLLLPRDL